MNAIKRILGVLIAICLFAVCADFWKYILVDDSRSFTRIMMHQLYESDGNIDILFVGSSHVYRTFVPNITDKEFGAYTFNAGTSSQFMDGSLAIIKEACKGNDIKHVYLEMCYEIAGGVNNKDRTGLTSTYIISDYMRPSFNKIDYLIHASDKKYWINSFLIPRRYWSNFFDSTCVKDIIASKQTEEYKNFDYQKKDGDEGFYVDRGFVANDEAVSSETYFNSLAFNEIEVGTLITCNSDWYKSLVEIVKYCKKNNIEITLFVTPEPEWTLVGKGNYDTYYKFLVDIANDLKVEFYDFNLCKNSFFDANDRSLFKDEDHLNTKGAEKFSSLFGQFFTGKFSPEDVFYESYSDKISEENRAFYGIAGPQIDDNGNKECLIISGSDEFEYQVIAIIANGKQVILKELDKSKQFSIPVDETGILRIVCKKINAEDIEVFEIDF